MYRIINATDGTVIGSTSDPLYIKRAKNGSLIPCSKDEAQGVSYKSTAYNLSQREGVDAEETVVVSEFDEGDTAVSAEASAKAIADTDALTVDHEMRITMLELGLEV